MRRALKPIAGSQQKRGIRFSFLCAMAFTVLTNFQLSATETEVSKCTSGEPQSRIEICSKIIQDSASTLNDRALAYWARGDAYLAKEEYDKAIADLDETIKLGLHRAGVYSRRGSAYVAKRQFERAIADLNEAIRLDPQFGLAYHSRGQAHQARGENDQAMADYSEAIRLGVVNWGI